MISNLAQGLPGAALAVIILILLAILGAVLAFAERNFARKESFFPGLILPAMFFFMALFSIVGSLPAVFSVAMEHGIGGLLQLLLVYLITFILTNLPTALTYWVYYRERKKLGETPWPFNRKKA